MVKKPWAGEMQWKETYVFQLCNFLWLQLTNVDPGNIRTTPCTSGNAHADQSSWCLFSHTRSSCRMSKQSTDAAERVDLEGWEGDSSSSASESGRHTFIWKCCGSLCAVRLCCIISTITPEQGSLRGRVCAYEWTRGHSVVSAHCHHKHAGGVQCFPSSVWSQQGGAW